MFFLFFKSPLEATNSELSSLSSVQALAQCSPANGGKATWTLQREPKLNPSLWQHSAHEGAIETSLEIPLVQQ